MPPPDESPPKTSPIKQEEVPPTQEEDYEAEESPQFVDESVAQSEINELKKLMKRMSNKRSIYIASKLSGTNQDYSLKEMSDRLADVEADITFCKNSKQRGENKIKADLMRTKLKLWSMSKIPTIGVDEGVAQLEFVKTDLKEQV